VAAVSICCSAAAASVSSSIWVVARLITWAASNETRPSAKAWAVARNRGRARPVATSSPARTADRPQPYRRNAAADVYPTSA
jgi:hypothetical protein